MIDAISPSISALSSTTPGASAGAIGDVSSARRTSGITSGEGPTTDFTSVLAQVAMNAVDTLKAGEATAMAGIRGQAPVQQVVEAVMNADQTLQSAIAIRDKVVAAYLELSRMQI